MRVDSHFYDPRPPDPTLGPVRVDSHFYDPPTPRPDLSRNLRNLPRCKLAIVGANFAILTVFRGANLQSSAQSSQSSRCKLAIVGRKLRCDLTPPPTPARPPRCSDATLLMVCVVRELSCSAFGAARHHPLEPRSHAWACTAHCGRTTVHFALPASHRSLDRTPAAPTLRPQSRRPLKALDTLLPFANAPLAAASLLAEKAAKPAHLPGLAILHVPTVV